MSPTTGPDGLATWPRRISLIVMMTADQCRAKADDCSRVADEAASYAVILQYEAMALQWRWLAKQAEWQDDWHRRHRQD
jgi:hypothetical protein